MNERKYNVLIVEDKQIHHMLYEKYINKIYSGTKILKANNGKEALEKVQESIFNEGIDLILMDIQMPVMDGLEATQKINELYNTNRKNKPPIIAITGSTEYKNNALRDGFTDFYTIPLKQDTMKKILEEYLPSKN
jgi:CheY-like chemotaxis protein